jgi:phage tail-like protein
MAEHVDPIVGYKYRLFDALGNAVGVFDELTGGDMEISTISYTQVLESGEAITRHIAGRTKYSPVSLVRAIDNESQPTYTLFDKTRAGMLKAVRQNFTVEMIGKGGKAALVRWDLVNAIPIKLSGFSFNDKTEAYYITVEIELQPEEIILTYIGSPEDVGDSV